eukprot:jgi/Botrbrau1/4039/Bobra.0016s0042.1
MLAVVNLSTEATIHLRIARLSILFVMLFSSLLSYAACMFSPVTKNKIESRMGSLGFAMGRICHYIVNQTKLCPQYLRCIRLSCLLCFDPVEHKGCCGSYILPKAS